MITLKTLGEAEPQAVFDQVARHLLTQNAKAWVRSTTGEYACRYRTPDGLKCAVGCLIADAEYTPMMEGKGAYGVARDYARSARHVHMLTRLQQVHDRSDVKDWPEELRGVAEALGLNTDVLDEAA